jgi:methenyltetrahydrofolate cyclohydrolase
MQPSDLPTAPLDDFLAALASKSPAPGGGAVTATTSALAAALGQMVVAYSVNLKRLSDHKPALESAIRKLENARALVLALAREDAEAYAHLSELMRTPDDHPSKAQALPAAALAATQVPLAVIAACADLLRLFESLVAITNRNLRSDLAIAAVLADAAGRASLWNVRINLPLLEECDLHGGIMETARSMIAEMTARTQRIEQGCL